MDQHFVAASYFILNLFIHSFIGERLDCFHFGGIMSNAAVNICLQVFCEHVFSLPLDMHLGE